MKNVILKVIASGAALGIAGFVTSRVVKSRRDKKNWRERIGLDLFIIRRILEGCGEPAVGKE